jgi:hypothetical protein
MSPHDASRRIEQAGRVCEALGFPIGKLRQVISVDLRQSARQFALNPRAYIEFDRLVVMEQKALPPEPRDGRERDEIKPHCKRHKRK